MSERKDVWDLDVVRRSRLRVVFDEELTREEAVQALLSDEYEDIIDEEDFGIDSAS